jgi:tetratricopeptide (TPR) repeat protein
MITIMPVVTPISIGGPGPSYIFAWKHVSSDGSASDGHVSEKANDLVVPWHDPAATSSILSLLSWHTRISEFTGRDQELVELLSWVKSSQRISIKFIIGPGGVGKSRLAAEFADILIKEKWAAGFVDLRKPQTFGLQPEGTLLIVDYPEEYQPAVRELFQDLAGLQIVGRLRVLFLTRQEISSWKDVIQDTRVETLTDMKPLRLAGLDDISAQEIYHSVSDEVGKIYDSDWKGITRDAIAAWLEEAPENDLALFIMAAAVHNILQPEDEVIKYKGREIIESLVERELARLRKVALSSNIRDQYLFARLLAIATIADIIPVDKLDRVFAEMGSLHKLPEYFDTEGELQKAGLIFNRAVQALKPDIVAAAFLIRAFSQKPEIAPELIWIALHDDINSGIYRLSRLSYDAEIVLGMHEHRISQWLAEAVKDDIRRAKTLEAFVSKQPLPLGLLDVAIATWRKLLSETDDEVEKARILNNLSVNLAGAGDTSGAMFAILKAVEIRERLAASNPEAFEPDLAMSLNNLGNRYSALGKRTEAMEATKRAVEIRERLAAPNPEAFEPDLAMSLNNLGNRYSALGKRTEAMEAIKRAVEIYERLAASKNI